MKTILQETNALLFLLPNQAEEAVRSVATACFSRSNTLRWLKNNLLYQLVWLRWVWEGIISTIPWSVAMMPLLPKGRRSEKGIWTRGVHQPEHIGAEVEEYYRKNINYMVKLCQKAGGLMLSRYSFISETPLFIFFPKRCTKRTVSLP